MPNLNPQEPEPAFIGLPTYLKLPYAKSGAELRELGADIAIVGAPFDMGVVHRPGARFGPRAIRSAGYFGSPPDWLYHLGMDVEPLKHVTVVDFGDANCPPNLIEKSHDVIRAKVGETLEAGALPIVLGGRPLHYLSQRYRCRPALRLWQCRPNPLRRPRRYRPRRLRRRPPLPRHSHAQAHRKRRYSGPQLRADRAKGLLASHRCLSMDEGAGYAVASYVGD